MKNAGAARGERVLKAIHRWLAVCALVILTPLAVSGMALQYFLNNIDEIKDGRISDEQMIRGFHQALAVAHQAAPGAAVTDFILNITGKVPYVVLSLGQRRVSVDLVDGRILPPDSRVHGALVQFHNSLFLGSFGRVICILAGLSLVYLCGSGIYFFIAAWVRRGRWAPFWGRPTVMKVLHRWVNTVFAVLLGGIAVTGIMMQTGPTGLHFWPLGGGAPMPQIGGGSSGFSDQELERMLTSTVARAAVTDPHHERLFMVDLSGPRLALTYADPREKMFSRLFLVSDGSEYAQPKGWFFTLLRLHRGDYFNTPGVVVSLACGAALLVLIGSGVWMYLAMLNGRKSVGKAGWFWF